MKKRVFALLLTLALMFSVLPGAVFAAEPAVPAEGSGGGILDAARGKLTRLSGLIRTETYEISETTRKAVTSKIVTGLKNRSAEIDVSSYGLSVQEGYSLYYEVLDAHYEFFYVQNGFSWAYSGDTITSIKPVYDTAYTSSDVTAFNNICSAVIAGLPQGTNVEKLLYLHDYLVTHCEYDKTYQKSSAFNALVEGSAVCDGYSKAFKYLCDLAGLTCEFVSSNDINHSWNMVRLSSGATVWYYIDCTWDDPINGCESCCEHVNFLLSKKACAASHQSSDWTNGRQEYVYDRATSTKYDNYWWKDLNRSVQWVGTQMCYARSTDFSHVYFRSTGATSETAVTIQGGGNKWYVWGDGSYWTESFITVAAQGGAYYYSTPTQIWKLTTGGEMTLAYTLSSAEQKKGYIYGIQGGADGLTYYIGQDPLQPSVASGTLNIPAGTTSKPVISSVKANVTTAAVGDKITWTATASGGSGNLQYYFILYKDGTNIKTRAYSTAKTFSYTPTEAGSYKVKVYVKDAADNKVNKTSTAVTVTAAGPTISSVKAGITSAYAGEKITWTATASGGTGTLKYYFILYKDGVKLKTRSYSTAKTFSYTPTEAGSYKVKVYVKDTAGNKVSKTSGKIAVTLGPPAIISVKAGKTSSVTGEKITWTVTAVGSEQPLQYYFVLYKDGVKIKTRSYSTTKTFSYTPTKAGSYKVKVYVKDASEAKVNKTSAAVTVS
ncbi:MAG: hypothetical protein J5633_03290 [Oscillospiraceae bacterium]|nr:hypothetical protein [Oscillospiraceae bacterium]